MKKILFRLTVVLVAVLVTAAIGITLVLDKAIKKGVELAGPRLTQVDVRLNRVSLSLLSGRLELQGLFIGNPQGYRSEAAIEMRSLVLATQPRSFLSDKLVVRTLNVQGPEITFEGGLKQNNLSQILENVNAALLDDRTHDDGVEKEKRLARKLQVDELVIARGKINVHLNALGNRSVALDLPEIHLTGLGTGPDGITAAELTDRLLKVLLEKATLAVAMGMSGSAAGLGETLGNSNQPTTDPALEQAAKSAVDLLQKKD